MRTSNRGIVALIAHEGIVPGPYRDSKGIWTWGVGHTARQAIDMQQSIQRQIEGLERQIETLRSSR